MCPLVLFESPMSLLIFYLLLLWIITRGILKYPPATMDLFVSPFSFIRFEAVFWCFLEAFPPPVYSQPEARFWIGRRYFMSPNSHFYHLYFRHTAPTAFLLLGTSVLSTYLQYSRAANGPYPTVQAISPQSSFLHSPGVALTDLFYLLTWLLCH